MRIVSVPAEAEVMLSVPLSALKSFCPAAKTSWVVLPDGVVVVKVAALAPVNTLSWIITMELPAAASGRVRAIGAAAPVNPER